MKAASLRALRTELAAAYAASRRLHRGQAGALGRLRAANAALLKAELREAVCWCRRSGALTLAVATPPARPPAGVIVLARGPANRLAEIVRAHARVADDGRSLLVPGVAEALDDTAALAAVERFEARILVTLHRPPRVHGRASRRITDETIAAAALIAPSEAHAEP